MCMYVCSGEMHAQIPNNFCTHIPKNIYNVTHIQTCHSESHQVEQAGLCWYPSRSLQDRFHMVVHHTNGAQCQNIGHRHHTYTCHHLEEKVISYGHFIVNILFI
jgi:hypothetical protein